MTDQDDAHVLNEHPQLTARVLRQTVEHAKNIGRIEEQDRIVSALLAAGKYETATEVLNLLMAEARN